METKSEALVRDANGQGSVSTAYGSPLSVRMGVKKRDSTVAGLDENSPESFDGGELASLDALHDDHRGNHEPRRRLPGVKRACNECRQQKLRCDVVQEPYTDCSRCRRLKLECKIESSFKRVGKRSKNAEMEREIQELRAKLASRNASPVTPSTPAGSGIALASPQTVVHPVPQSYGSREAVASLLDLRSGFSASPTDFVKTPDGKVVRIRRLEHIALPEGRIKDLFHRFFLFYHPYLPFLDAGKSPDTYYESSPLLFWTILSVAARRYSDDPQLLDSLCSPVMRLVWMTLAEVPQNYHIVKALCLLCTWPFPVSSTSADPTFMLNGVMIHLAMQIGLHKPSHAQDFSKFRVELREEELRDRIKTWATCNIVAQRVATGYGQPPCTLIDQTLGKSPTNPNFKLPDDIDVALQIEEFVNSVTQAFYCNRHGPEGLGLLRSEEMAPMTSVLSVGSTNLQNQLNNKNGINQLYYYASQLHLRLGILFDSSESKSYIKDLLALYNATITFLEAAFNLDASETPLAYATNYVLQMMLAAGFALYRLLNSPFVAHVDPTAGRAVFNRTISTIRSISVMNNDLPQRMAEVLAQLWTGAGSGMRHQREANTPMDNSLRLKVRCRMSMSLLYDSIWRWREDFQAKGANLEASLKNPTNPDPTGTDGSMSDPTLLSMNMNGGAQMPTSGGDNNYEVFDPLTWMLDGFLDLPYSLPAMQGLDNATPMH